MASGSSANAKLAISDQTGALRLDGLVNPFAPSPSARELISTNSKPALLAELLKTVLGERLGVPPDNLVLAASANELISAYGSLDNASVVQSPDLITGKMLTVTEAVRLARSSEFLLIDERAGGIAHRDHLPVFREFDNVALLRSFDPWIEPLERSLSYLLMKRRIDRPPLPDALAIDLSLATLRDRDWLAAAMRQTAKQRAHLVRSLRKLNMVRPLPGSALCVAARVERGDRESLREFLGQRCIDVHYPDTDGHRDLIRISIASPQATRSLCHALIAWAATLDNLSESPRLI